MNLAKKKIDFSPNSHVFQPDIRWLWVRFGEHFGLKLSSLLDWDRHKLFVSGGCCLYDQCICSCITPHAWPLLFRTLMKRLEPVQMGWKWGLWSTVTLLCPLVCVLWCESELSLWVSLFCYLASSLVFKTTFRTSHQALYSAKGNWLFPFQSATNISFIAFEKESSFLKISINHLFKHAWNFLLFLVSLQDEKGGKCPSHNL